MIRADSFALAGPASEGSTPYYPFIFRNTPFTDPVTKTVFPVGAYIKSAFIDYASIGTANIKALAVTSAEIANAAITTAKIDSLAVTSAKIANAAITTAKIGNAQITTAKIGDLQVDTLKIKDDAVTVSSAATATGTTVEITVKTSGGKVRIEGASYYSRSGLSSSTLYCRLYRNGTQVNGWVIDSSGGRTVGDIGHDATYYWFNGDRSLPIFIDEPPAGTHVYKIVAEISSETSIGVMEVKK